MLLRAPIDALDRRVPRWAATTIIVIASIASVAGLLALGSVQLSQEIDVVGEAVTERIEAVDPDSAIGQFLVDGRVAERIEEHLDELPSQVILGSPDPADGARLGLEALLVIVLMLYALVNGPQLARSVLGGDHPRWWAQFVRDGVASGASQVRRLLAIATISGLIGLAIASLFGLPGTTVLALWVGLWAVVPIFGPVVGYAPLVVLASLDGWPNATGVVVLAGLIALASWYADRHVYSWDLRSTGRRTGPFGLTVALVVGLQFGWLIGPLVAIFLMAAAVSTLAALGARHRRTEPEHHRSTRPTKHDRSRAPPGVSQLEPSRRPVGGDGDLDRGDRRRRHRPRGRPRSGPGVDHHRHRVGDGARSARRMARPTTPFSDEGRRSVPSWSACWRSWRRCWSSPSRRSSTSVRDLDDQLPQIAADLERLPLIGDELAERGVADRLQTTLEEAPDRLASDTGPLERTLRSIGDGLRRDVLDPAHHGDRR